MTEICVKLSKSIRPSLYEHESTEEVVAWFSNRQKEEFEKQTSKWKGGERKRKKDETNMGEREREMEQGEMC